MQSIQPDLGQSKEMKLRQQLYYVDVKKLPGDTGQSQTAFINNDSVQCNPNQLEETKNTCGCSDTPLKYAPLPKKTSFESPYSVSLFYLSRKQ